MLGERLKGQPVTKRRMQAPPVGEPLDVADDLLLGRGAGGEDGPVRILAQADPPRKAKTYADLGARPVYQPGNRKVLVAAGDDQDLIGQGFVSEGGLELLGHRGHRETCGYL